MADYEIVTDLYRVAGVRNIGPAYVFPKTRVSRKVKKRYEKEEKEEKEPPESPEEKSEGIDIKV